MRRSRLNDKGEEVNNPTSLIIGGLKRPLTMSEQIENAIKGRFSLMQEDKGNDTWEESQDFDIEDPFDMPMPNTIYTVLQPEELGILPDEGLMNDPDNSPTSERKSFPSINPAEGGTGKEKSNISEQPKPASEDGGS